MRPRLLAGWFLGACAGPPPEGGGAAAPGDSGGESAGFLAFPLAEREPFQTVLGVDHDPTVQEPGIDQLTCLDHHGRSFPHCYDEHDGTDYILHGGFEAMDAGSVAILAAADGVVAAAEDGHYDRCHGSLETMSVDCDGHDGIANSVILEHEGGWRTLYWHMMEGSVAVAVGQAVRRGEVLGRVGSSGFSTQPHLHFELQAADGTPVDPYAGPESQPESWWCDQGELDALPGDCP